MKWNSVQLSVGLTCGLGITLATAAMRIFDWKGAGSEVGFVHTAVFSGAAAVLVAVIVVAPFLDQDPVVRFLLGFGNLLGGFASSKEKALARSPLMAGLACGSTVTALVSNELLRLRDDVQQVPEWAGSAGALVAFVALFGFAWKWGRGQSVATDSNL